MRIGNFIPFEQENEKRREREDAHLLICKLKACG